MNPTTERMVDAVARHHGLAARGAALAIVNVYIGHAAEDPELWDVDTGQLTPDGIAAVWTEIGHGVTGGVNDTLLAALADAATWAREALANRDALVRAAFRARIPRARIADAAQVTPARVYQIQGEEPISR